MSPRNYTILRDWLAAVKVKGVMAVTAATEAAMAAATGLAWQEVALEATVVAAAVGVVAMVDS